MTCNYMYLYNTRNVHCTCNHLPRMPCRCCVTAECRIRCTCICRDPNKWTCPQNVTHFFVTALLPTCIYLDANKYPNNVTRCDSGKMLMCNYLHNANKVQRHPHNDMQILYNLALAIQGHTYNSPYNWGHTNDWKTATTKQYYYLHVPYIAYKKHFHEFYSL